MEISKRIEAFARLGEAIRDFLGEEATPIYGATLSAAVKRASVVNPWFTEEFVRMALSSWAEVLTAEKLYSFVAGRKFSSQKPRRVAVITAGNIPLVGFHDFLSVLISGNIFVGKLSSKDNILLPALASVLIDLAPAFEGRIIFEKELLKNFDAVIATGSDNSARYFDYYFGKYPSVIRRNRSSVAVIHKGDGEAVYRELGKDIFYYFGLGCRSVSKIYVPEDFEFEPFMNALNAFENIAENTKYFNNYEYNKAVFLVNRTEHFDTGFLLLKEDESMSSAVATLNFEYYENEEALYRNLMLQKHKLQCLVSSKFDGDIVVKPGKTQFPALTDWADGINILEFLEQLT